MIRTKELICLTAILMGLTSCQNEKSLLDNSPQVKTSNQVIGEDDRSTTVGNLNKTFYSKVGQIITNKKLGDSGISTTSTCSAALVAKRFIITAAHCAYMSKTDDLLKNSYFYPGINDFQKSEYDRYPIVRVYHPKAYRNTAPYSSDDIAIMELGPDANGKHAGERVGYYGFWGKSSFPNGPTLTIGYPGDKPMSKQFYQSGCHIENGRENTLEMDCDIYSGQSGSPIFVYSSDYDSFYIHGVVTSESLVYKVNYGSFISSERHKIINSIISGEFKEDNKFEEKWGVKNIHQEKLVRVVVKNTCQKRDALIALNYKNLENEWVKVGFYKVGSGKAKELAVSENGVFYLYAMDTRQNTIISGSYDFYLPKNGYIEFKKYNANKYGDYQVEVPCY